ncbi:MAG: cell division protein FtsL [bacterium]|jgi:cell division protein FtsL
MKKLFLLLTLISISFSAFAKVMVITNDQVEDRIVAFLIIILAILAVVFIFLLVIYLKQSDMNRDLKILRECVAKQNTSLEQNSIPLKRPKRQSNGNIDGFV